MRPQSVTPRRGELVDAGQVRDSGRQRPTSSGRMATVWVATGSPPAPPSTPAASSPAIAAAHPAGPCDRCGCRDFVDVPIHDGQSVRRDCARCGRMLAFPRWYGQERPQ
jgi:hypothetical protein